MMAINIMIITTMTTILINTTTIILCKVFGFFRDKNGETGWLQGKGASWNLLVFPGEGNVQKPKSRKNLKSIHFCQIKPFWKDLCFLFKLSMQKLAQCELNICTPTLGIFLVYTLGTPPLHNCDLILIKIICYFYNFPTLCIDRQCCAMRIEEGQKYDFAKIGKYGCGEPEKNCCKSWLPFSSLSTGERRGGDGCLLPAAHQIDPRGFPNISGTSWGPPINYVRTIGDFPLQWEPRSAPSFLGKTRLDAL